jgi:hypothetical protein
MSTSSARLLFDAGDLSAVQHGSAMRRQGKSRSHFFFFRKHGYLLSRKAHFGPLWTTFSPQKSPLWLLLSGQVYLGAWPVAYHSVELSQAKPFSGSFRSLRRAFAFF